MNALALAGVLLVGAIVIGAVVAFIAWAWEQLDQIKDDDA